MADRTIRVMLDMITSGYKRGATTAVGATRGVRSELGQLTAVANRNSEAFSTAGIAMGAAGAAMALGLTKATQEAAEFESTLTKSTTLIGISTEEMDKMGDAALGLGDTGQGPQELADALFFVQSAGLRGSAALDVVEASAKAASIGLGDTATIADLVTSAVNAYGTETLSASQATDILIGAVREGKAEASELAGVMGRVLPIASEMGIQFEEVGGALASMTRTGTKADEAVTQLRSIMTSLLKPARQSEKALEGMGLSSQMLRDTIQKDGLWAALQMLREAMGDNEAALAKVFPNVRALAGFLDLTGKNAEANAKTFENMADTTGLLADGFEQWSDTTEAAQKRFSASMEAARISLGENLQGPMNEVLDTGSGMAQMFTDMPDPMQQVVATGGAVGAVALTLAGGFLAAAPRIQQTRVAMADLNRTMPRTVGLMRGFGSLLAGPVGLAIGTATVGLSLYAQQKAEAEEATKAFIATLDAETGALTENSREYAISELQKIEAFKLAEQLGVSHKTLTDAVLGNADAEREVRAAIEGRTSSSKTLHRISHDLTTVFDDEAQAADTLEFVLEKLAPAIADATDEGRRQKEALAEQEGKWLDVQHAVNSGMGAMEASIALHEQQREESEATGGAVEEMAGEYDDLEGEVDEATQALQDYLEELRMATDPVFAMNDALGNLEQTQRDSEAAVRELERAQEDLDELRGDSEASARDLEDAELRVEEAQRKVEQSGWAVADALAELEAKALDGDLSFDEFSAKLAQWVEDGELTADEADHIRERLRTLRGEAEDYEGDYDAAIKADQRDAQNAINGATREAEAWDKTTVSADFKARTRGIGAAQKDLNRVANRRRTARINTTTRNSNRVNRRLNNAARNRVSYIIARMKDETGGWLGRIHTGGKFLAGGGIQRYHSGGRIGGDRLASDERLIIGQTGERVLSRAQNDNFERLTRSLGRAAGTASPVPAGRLAGAGGGTVDVNLHITGNGRLAKEFHEGMRQGEIQLNVNGQRVRVG